jgi:hypothetical protein
MLRRAVDTSACAARNCFPTGLKKRLRESSYDLKQSSWAQQPCCTPLSFLPPPPHHHYSHRRMRAKEGGEKGADGMRRARDNYPSTQHYYAPPAGTRTAEKCFFGSSREQK